MRWPPACLGSQGGERGADDSWRHLTQGAESRGNRSGRVPLTLQEGQGSAREGKRAGKGGWRGLRHGLESQADTRFLFLLCLSLDLQCFARKCLSHFTTSTSCVRLTFAAQVCSARVSSIASCAIMTTVARNTALLVLSSMTSIAGQVDPDIESGVR